MYKILFKRSAKKEFEKMPSRIIIAIDNALQLLKENPFPSGCRKIIGDKDNSYRIRIGEYRVIYTVENAILIITIIRVRHRKDAYKK